jgi:hypothetical protein
MSVWARYLSRLSAPVAYAEQPQVGNAWIDREEGRSRSAYREERERNGTEQRRKSWPWPTKAATTSTCC